MILSQVVILRIGVARKSGKMNSEITLCIFLLLFTHSLTDSVNQSVPWPLRAGRYGHSTGSRQARGDRRALRSAAASRGGPREGTWGKVPRSHHVCAACSWGDLHCQLPTTQTTIVLTISSILVIACIHSSFSLLVVPN